MGKTPKKGMAKSTKLVCSCLQSLTKWVNEVYSLRHNTEANEGAKTMPAPVGHGGTFKQILQRAWQDPEKLLNESLEMLKTVGYMSADSSLDDLGTLLTLQVT